MYFKTWHDEADMPTKDEEAQSTKNAYASLSQEDRDKLKEFTRSLNKIKQVEDDMKMMKENPSLYYM